MIIVQVKGGLGNQFFTYATAYALAVSSRNALLLDEVIYQTFYSIRKCRLHEFQIDYSDTLIKRASFRSKIGQKVFAVIHRQVLQRKYHPYVICEKQQFAYQPFYIQRGKNYYLDGYWQNYRYFHSCREDLIRQFTPLAVSSESEALIEYAKKTLPVMVHVRRGDYMTFQGGKCLSMQYYFDAMDRLRQIRGEKAPFWIVTDDIGFCRNAFSQFQNLLFLADSHLSDIEEFWVMCHGKDFIIANSSFSWWAAYLSASEDKTVWCPVADMWTEDFYPPEWEKLPASIEKNTGDTECEKRQQ